MLLRNNVQFEISNKKCYKVNKCKKNTQKDHYKTRALKEGRLRIFLHLLRSFIGVTNHRFNTLFHAFSSVSHKTFTRIEYRVGRKFCGSLILRIGDFLWFAGKNFCGSR